MFVGLFHEQGNTVFAGPVRDHVQGNIFQGGESSGGESAIVDRTIPDDTDDGKGFFNFDCAVFREVFFNVFQVAVLSIVRDMATSTWQSYRSGFSRIRIFRILSEQNRKQATCCWI